MGFKLNKNYLSLKGEQFLKFHRINNVRNTNSGKENCRKCYGKGYCERTVVIGSIVTNVRDSCLHCRGTGKTNR